MSFHEVRFPTDISFGSSGGPEYSTDVIINHAGHEKRNVNWAVARSRYNVAHGLKTQAQLDELIAFFRARQGKAYGFRFKDWADYKVSQTIIGTGNGVLTAFQLSRSYVSGGETVTRAINKPVNGTVKIYFGNMLQTSGYLVNYITGVVTFTVAPANGTVIKADFEFDVPVRFDTDKLSIRLEDYKLSSWNDIPLVEVRV